MKITDNVSLKMQISSNDKLEYIFQTSEGFIERRFTAKQPSQLNARHDVIKYIINLKGWNGLKSEWKQGKIENDLMPVLKEEYERVLTERLELIQKQESAKRKSKEIVIKNGKFYYDNMNNNLLFVVKELCDWLSAGETHNIIYAFLAYFSQVCFKSGINVIMVGEASSGKNHIEATALDFIPDESIIMEKGITPAAIFRRAEQNREFYDGKIVRYGDMGGSSDVEFMEGSLNLMKELESEAYLNKPINVTGEGGWTVKDLELIGTPSVTYTTVPGDPIDPQILSRGITLTPRVDNQFEFFERAKILGFNGKSKNYLDNTIKPEVEKIKQTIEYILSLFDENVTFINPYAESLEILLSRSAYYKRDYDKYMILLSSIAALDKNRMIDYDGKKYMTIIADDILILEAIIKDYIEIIQANVRKGAMIILNELQKLYEEYHENNPFIDSLEEEFQITKNEFISSTDLNYSKKTVSSYFTELVELGYLEVSDIKTGNKNSYLLTKRGLSILSVKTILTEPDWDDSELPSDLIELCKNKDIITNYNLYDSIYIYFNKPKWMVD